MNWISVHSQGSDGEEGLVPRIRCAVRCSARSSRTGRQCGAWSVRGGTVCVSHGGAAPRVAKEARLEQARRVMEAEFDRSWERYQRALVEWQVQRIVTVSRLLGIAPERVGFGELIWCHVQHGEPPLDDEAPKITDFPGDRRRLRAVRGR